MSHWDRHFFASTRGQIVSLLRRTRHTVDDLAAWLGLTDNAVRAHLNRLERDGLVQQHGVRRGERRPAVVYELTPQAEGLFPKAYAPALAQLLEALNGQMPPDKVEQLVRDAGKRLAGSSAASSGSAEERLQVAADALSALGGLAEVAQSEGGQSELRSFSCPLGDLVVDHPQLCTLAEALVREVSGLPVHEECVRSVANQQPRCRFVLN